MCREGENREFKIRRIDLNTTSKPLCSFQLMGETYIAFCGLERRTPYKITIYFNRISEDLRVYRRCRLKDLEFTHTAPVNYVDATFHVRKGFPCLFLTINQDISLLLDLSFTEQQKIGYDAKHARVCNFAAKNACVIGNYLYVLKKDNNIISFFLGEEGTKVTWFGLHTQVSSIRAKTIVDPFYNRSLCMFIFGPRLIYMKLTKGSKYIKPRLPKGWKIVDIAAFGSQRFTLIILAKNENQDTMLFRYNIGERKAQVFQHQLYSSQPHPGPSCISCLDFSSNEYLAIGTANGQVYIWNCKLGFDVPQLEISTDIQNHKVDSIKKIIIKKKVCLQISLTSLRRRPHNHRNFLYRIPHLDRELSLLPKQQSIIKQVEEDRHLAFLSTFARSTKLQIETPAITNSVNFSDYTKEEFFDDGNTTVVTMNTQHKFFVFAQGNNVQIYYPEKGCPTFGTHFKPMPPDGNVVALASPDDFHRRIIAAINTPQTSSCVLYSDGGNCLDYFDLNVNYDLLKIKYKEFITSMAYRKDRVLVLGIERLQQGTPTYWLQFWDVYPWKYEMFYLNKTRRMTSIQLPEKVVSININPKNLYEYCLVYESGKIEVKRYQVVSLYFQPHFQ